ncbi:hypothetical protein [Streptomyces sp. NPDC012888]
MTSPRQPYDQQQQLQAQQYQPQPGMPASCCSFTAGIGSVSSLNRRHGY